MAEFHANLRKVGRQLRYQDTMFPYCTNLKVGKAVIPNPDFFFLIETHLMKNSSFMFGLEKKPNKIRPGWVLLKN